VGDEDGSKRPALKEVKDKIDQVLSDKKVKVAGRSQAKVTFDQK
jgi:hypothetical protein